VVKNHFGAHGVTSLTFGDRAKIVFGLVHHRLTMAYCRPMNAGEIKCAISEPTPDVLLVVLSGRLDAFGSKIFSESMEKALQSTALAAVIDLKDVPYLSSAGLRVFTILYKKFNERGGTMVLCNLQDYCRGVFEISGMGTLFPMAQTQSEAMTICEARVREKHLFGSWASLETWETPEFKLKVVPGRPQVQGRVEIIGDVKEVLHASITENGIASKAFSETEFSIGCGGLGEDVEDYFPIMGEMITIGGTMVWLPTDGHDTPDFLIPRKSSRTITLRTVFNAKVEGGFNECFLLETTDPDGMSIDSLYRMIFEAAKKRRPDYRGVVSIAGRAEFTEVYGAGIRKSPILRFQPANGKTIVHSSNIAEWFSGDRAPRLRNVTGLLCGIGVDLTADLSHFNSADVDAAFYRHPDNTAGKPHLLHNHAVFFSQQAWREKMLNLNSEIQRTVEEGDFRDMRHLLDQSRINKAFLGISYTQEIHRLACSV